MGLTQAELGRRLGISRASVNAWEMGISTPTTQYISRLSEVFHVSADYLLGISTSNSLDLSGLDESDITVLHALVEHLRMKNH